MELMSSLLLCTLVALVRTLDSAILGSDVKINEAKKIDFKCTKCIDCMERAIRAHRAQTRLRNGTPNTEELANDWLKSRFQHKISTKERSAAEATIATKSMKKKKSNGATKKSKGTKIKSKGVIVTKFNVDGKVYGLKLKEIALDANGQANATTCSLYSVKKYFPCNSSEGNSMLTSAKKKASKKSIKKRSSKALILTEQLIENTEPNLRSDKREVGTTSSNTRLTDQYMTSMEEFYENS